MLSKEQFVEELDAIIKAEQKKQTVEDAIADYVPGAFIIVPDANEERAIRYLSGLIGLGLETDSALMDWYYSPFRKGRIHTDFWVSFGPVGDKQLIETPEQFYDFYVGDKNDKV